jgi:hypothetical protein
MRYFMPVENHTSYKDIFSQVTKIKNKIYIFLSKWEQTGSLNDLEAFILILVYCFIIIF